MTNWQNISDDELDGLFRDAADNHEVEYDPAAWQNMAQKLDSAKPSDSASSVWKRRSLLLLALLLLSTIVWVGYQSSNKVSNDLSQNKAKSKENQSKSNVDTDKVATEKSKDSDSINSKSENSDLNSKNSDSESSNSKDSDSNISSIKSKQDLKNRDLNMSNTQKTTSFSALPNAENNNNLSSNNLKKGDFTNHPNKNKTQSTDNQLIINNSKQSNNIVYSENNVNSKNTNKTKYSKYTINLDYSTNSKQTKNSINSELPIINNNSININKIENNIISENTENSIQNKQITLSLNDLKNHSFQLQTSKNLPNIAYSSPIQPISKPKSDDMFKRGLYIRPVFSPDLSIVVGNQVEKVGTNWGGLLEYRFNKHWSVQTGVLRAKKIYDAYPQQYTWIWKMPNTPLLEISAACKMLDIPLNIRYDLTTKPNARWYASTGITSYSMLKETYNYYYENNNDPTIKWKVWNGNTGKYLWSVANLSMGYERRISRRWTIQAEPFVKIPLGNVGFGKVRLLSAGLFVSAKYPLIR